jgi:UDPglucose 6-dehydrogenase
MRLAVIGTGRVGVPTAASLAGLGYRVAATDTDAGKLERLAGGVVPFYEPGLQELVRAQMDAGRLSFVPAPREALSEARAAFVCVGTPPGLDGAADVSAVHAAAEVVARLAQGSVTVVIKSTVPAGTARDVAGILAAAGPGSGFPVVANPEFLREGMAVEDSLNPLRILVGTEDREAAALMRDIYAGPIAAGVPYIETDPQTAELAKHACNAFLAMKVSYVNALARVCEAVGADVTTVARAMSADERIGSSYLEAGLGYGGYCLPKDVRAFERLAATLGFEFGLLREVERVNRGAVEAAAAKVLGTLGDPAGKRVALLGLAFKPGTDNVTDAPALRLARRLAEEGVEVAGFDPQAGANAKAALPDLEVTGDPYAALEAAHCAVVCTEWDEVLELDLARARSLMAKPVLVDARNVFDPRDTASAGFKYLPTGRPPPSA